MIVFAALLALAVGVVLGLLGGGGAILTTPILVYVVGLDPKEAITGSLLVVGVTSAVSTAFHTRLGNVDFRTGALFGGAGMAGAFLGGRLAGSMDGAVLLVAFAALMLITALTMLRGRPDVAGDGHIHPLKTIAVGATVGFIAGLLGAGGGFLIVPALVLFANVPMRRAIGTSLFVITLQSFAGFAGHFAHARVQLNVLGPVTLMAVLGTVAGVFLATRVSTVALRRGFAWFVLAMGIFVLSKELAPLTTALCAAVVLVITVLVSRTPGREAKQCASQEAPSRNAA